MTTIKTDDALTDPDNIWLCAECDRVMSKIRLAFRESAFCPGCKSKVAQGHYRAFSSGLALSISGLLLLIPASFLPLLHMDLFARITDHSILSGIHEFIIQGMWVPALLIFLGTMASPFIYLALNVLVLTCMHREVHHGFLKQALHIIGTIRGWSMLEVYLLGVIIAIVKLGDIAKVSPGFGLVTLAGVMICQFLVALLVNPVVLWERLEEIEQQNKKGSL